MRGISRMEHWEMDLSTGTERPEAWWGKALPCALLASVFQARRGVSRMCYALDKCLSSRKEGEGITENRRIFKCRRLKWRPSKPDYLLIVNKHKAAGGLESVTTSALRNQPKITMPKPCPSPRVST